MEKKRCHNLQQMLCNALPTFLQPDITAPILQKTTSPNFVTFSVIMLIAGHPN